MSNLETLTVLKQLGKGGYATVLLAQDSCKSNYAVKMISKSRNQTHNIKRETEAGRRLSHPNIVQYKAHSEDADNDYLIFDYMDGMDLFTYFEKERQFKEFTEEEANGIARQLVDALLASHKAGVVHLDIKLDNIMINPRGHTTKLIDFGLCDFITHENRGFFNRRVGSEEYCAPELFSRDEYFSGEKLDVWCLGIVLYCLFTSQFPFDTKRRKAIMAVGGQHPQPKLNFGSNQCRDLLKKMLETDPTKRISMQEVANHPWFACQAP